MLRPTTTMSLLAGRKRWYAASASPAQSAQRVGSMSSTTVPWPGSSGISTWKPASASASATPRIDPGLPVKPCSDDARRAVPSPCVRPGFGAGR